MSHGSRSAKWFVRDGPNLPKYPLALIHPLGPIFRHLPLSLRRHLLYLHAWGRWGNFSTPRLFSEKMQWRILNDRRPLIAWTCDKLASKEYARKTAEAAGITLRIPATYWSGTDVRDLYIAAQSFPDRWVLKPNHSCGRLRIIDSSAAPIDWEDLANAVGARVARDEEELVLGHWAYSQARHLLIAEEYVEHKPDVLTDYKLIGFGGRVQDVIASADASDIGTHPIVYNRDFAIQGASALTKDQLDRAAHQLNKREQEAMIVISERIIAPFDQMRVDLYVSAGELWFGELSTYHSSGLKNSAGRRLSAVSNTTRGALWELPSLSAADAREQEWKALLLRDD